VTPLGCPLLIFDLDNTLVDRAALFREWANEVATTHNLDQAAVEWLLEADDDGMAPRAALYTSMRDRLGLVESSDALAGWWRSTLGRLRCDAGTIAALAELRTAGFAIGIATNGGPVQTVKIEATGLREFVDAISISSIVGFAKPDRRIFEVLARDCGTTLDGAWVIGDRADADIAGAVAVGAISVWIHRGRSWEEDAFRPTFRVQSVADVAALIIGRPYVGSQAAHNVLIVRD
jgi:putative hydrolase of the HAD superfamily